MPFPRYGSYAYRSQTRYAPILGMVAVALVFATLIAWMVAEFACSRTFVGTLVSREAPITFSYDEERLTIETDGDGNSHITTTGDDETIAHKTYLLTFYAEGEMRKVIVGTSRGYTPHVKREDLALAALAANDVEPPHYTHAKLNTEYLVKVSGWLIDGRIEDITPMVNVRVE